MIRDRVVVGIHSDKLSEKLQLDPNLTLETAVMQARQADTVKLQQVVIRGEGATFSYENDEIYLQHHTCSRKRTLNGRCTVLGNSLRLHKKRQLLVKR